MRSWLLSAPHGAVEKGRDFADVSRDAWYRKYVRVVSAMGIMTGKSGTTFHPEALVRRSEAMATFNRLLDHRPTVDGLIERRGAANPTICRSSAVPFVLALPLSS